LGCRSGVSTPRWTCLSVIVIATDPALPPKKWIACVMGSVHSDGLDGNLDIAFNDDAPTLPFLLRETIPSVVGFPPTLPRVRNQLFPVRSFSHPVPRSANR